MTRNEMLDDTARLIIENNIDDVHKDPRKFEENARKVLSVVEIKPDLETILSFAIGIISGVVWGYYRIKYKREPKADEVRELQDLFKRRAWELRQDFMRTRIQKQPNNK